MRLADVEFNIAEGVVHARVTGEIDMSNANDVGAALTGATPNDALGVVLDLSRVDYIDSAGIHLLYRLRQGLRTRGQQFAVVIPSGSPVHDALRLAGVQEHLDVSTSIEDATVVLRGGAASR